jgi:hypothetical protein
MALVAGTTLAAALAWGPPPPTVAGSATGGPCSHAELAAGDAPGRTADAQRFLEANIALGTSGAGADAPSMASQDCPDAADM